MDSAKEVNGKMLWIPYGHWYMQKKTDFKNRSFCKVLSVSDLKNLERFEISFSEETWKEREQ